MRLTEEQKKILLNSLKQFTQRRQTVCAVCGTANWEINDTIFELREFNDGNFVVGGTIYPVIPMMCSVCSNTILLNALRLGVIKGPQSPQEGEKK